MTQTERAVPHPVGDLAAPAATSTTNPCKLCAPLGASTAFRGVRGAIPILHGSQGCATYIRRYLISHFREPVDVASSSFDEKATIFGGGANLAAGIDNVVRQYAPELVGVATTCLAETIGEDVPMLLRQYRAQRRERELPPIVHVSTPAYAGTQAEGFAATVQALVAQLGEVLEPVKQRPARVNLLPTMLSAEDLRHLRELVESFGLRCTLLPDYSETLDGGDWEHYERLPRGGTPVEEIRTMPQARASVEFVSAQDSAGAWLETSAYVPLFRLPLPIGVEATDRLVEALVRISGRDLPSLHQRERGRLVDAYMDGHRYVFRKRVIVVAEPELAAGLAAFVSEIGMVPVLCATGGGRKAMQLSTAEAWDARMEGTSVMDDADYSRIEDRAQALTPDLILGSSKAYKLSEKLGCPLIRVGFPIHDRFGGARLLHVGYRGTLRLFDEIVNTFLSIKQSRNPVGYTYL